MVFASPVFIFYFLPLVIIGYFLLPKSFKNLFLLFSSILFYSWGAPKFIFAILVTTTIDYFLAKIIDSSDSDKKRKISLTLSVIMNIGFLFYFKYCNFFIENINQLFQLLGIGEINALHIIMPIGISFYTFESITYLVDVYRKIHKPLHNFWDYQLYILFFPKLIAGPITRYHEIADQITERFKRNYTEDFILGFNRFCIGLFKKVIIANPLGAFADQLFEQPEMAQNSSVAWLCSFAYTFQIYFDFSGYSDMALGLARIFGFQLPENFNNPYISKSITEFWRRWHMTLGNWMKNYLYIPLGGNKVESNKRLYFNLSFIFLVSGFWHGASWNFIVWGALHGLFMVLERLFLLKYLVKIPNLISVIYTFIIVNFAWVLFRANNFNDALIIYKNMLSFNFSKFELTNDVCFYFLLAVSSSFMLLFKKAAIIQNFFYHSPNSILKQIVQILICLSLFLISCSFVYGSNFNPFIYFRF